MTPPKGARRATEARVAAALAAATAGGGEGDSGTHSASGSASSAPGTGAGASASTTASAASAALRRRGPTRRTVTPATRLGTFVVVYELDKAACYSRYLSIEDVGSALAAFLGAEAQVTWSARWAPQWLVLVRPPAWGEDVRLDRPVADAVHDALLEHAVVNGISGVTKAVPTRDGGTWYVETEGSDLLSLAQLVHVDPLRTTTNNIQEVARLLGVEAAVCLTQAELHRVLSFDGSYVDPRHTWLLADTVARAGCINPLNRHKMEELGGSLLQCASFEQTLDVFEQGAAFGKSDALGGATEKLIVGQPVHVGTGSFGLLVPEAADAVPATPTARATFVAPLHADGGDDDIFDVGTDVVTVQPLAKRARRGTDAADVETQVRADRVAPLLRRDARAPAATGVHVESLLRARRAPAALGDAVSATVAATACDDAALATAFVPPPDLLLAEDPAASSSAATSTSSAGMASLFGVMRKHAQKRVPVWVSCDVVLACSAADGDDGGDGAIAAGSTGDDGMNAAEYADIEAAMDAYMGWAERPRYVQVTEVHYTSHEKPVVSRVSFVDGGVRTQHEVTSIQELAAVPLEAPLDAWALRGCAYTRQAVAVSTLPASVVPSRVRICHNKAYVKGSWTITLTRAWEGRNNLEAEARQRGGSVTATFHVRIELTTPWELMEERGSTNVAMAASMVQRAIACLSCIADEDDEDV